MTSVLPEPFPSINIFEDYNPGIRLFGKRFIIEQTTLEFLTEFLALVLFNKCVDNNKFSSPFIPIEKLRVWSNKDSLKLYYELPVKLNLKLFSFLSSSRIDARHEIHKKHYKKISEILSQKIKVNTGDYQGAIERIEELLRSYQGAGLNRAWCAKSFYPISKELLTQETIWNESIVKREPVSSWDESITKFKKYYSVSKHRFMSRGGELLYLQLCNAFTMSDSTVKDFAKHIGLNNDESNLIVLFDSLQKNFNKLSSKYTKAFDNIVNYIELLDKETHERTNSVSEKLNCEWCPKESWPEGYLFAVEVNRLLQAELDPVERLEMLMTGCVLQVLRSLCAQSVRYAKPNVRGNGGALKYSWLFSNPFSPVRQQRVASQRNLLSVQGIIYKV
jgi:hypothetical protein